jgi:methionyl-tRNA formyltransferase
MRIVFTGAIDFSRHCLEETLKNGGNVVGVLTLNERRGRFNSDYADLRPVAEEYGVPVYHMRKIGDPDTIELVRSLNPDVIFVFGLSQLVPKEVLDIPRLGCIGSHPAMLPANRGRHPLIWALVKGFESSGLTFFYLDEGADSGDILWQKPFDIDINDDSAILYEKIKALASEAIGEFLPQLENGTAPRIPQDHSKATYLRKRGEDDGVIDWSKSLLEIHNLVRGLTHPYVGAHTFLDGEKLIVWRTRLVDDQGVKGSHSPGTVFQQGDDVCAATYDGYLKIVEYESADGATLKAGTVLGEQS